MLPRIASFWLVLLVLLTAASAGAQTKDCDALKDTPRQTALAVLKSSHPYDCCDGTILQCLSRKPVCALARRLANDVCRRAAAGQTRADIERELVRRASSSMSPKVTIDTSGATVAGDSNAPVEIVLYLCTRCPFCAKLTPELHEAVTKGKLKGKAKLVVRPFPVRSHKHSTLGGKAMVAAERLGSFWPYLLHIYAQFDHFNPDSMPECAGRAGLDPEKFKALLTEPSVEQALVRAKKEGIRNRVDATPSVFINRRKYEAEVSLVAIADFVEEVAEGR